MQCICVVATVLQMIRAHDEPQLNGSSGKGLGKREGQAVWFFEPTLSLLTYLKKYLVGMWCSTELARI